MILVRTVTIPEPSTRASVVEALAGPGGPAGGVECRVEGSTLTIRFESDRTSPELVDALIAIEIGSPTGAPIADPAAAAAIAARGLREPDLDVSRLIETYFP